uniref:Ig-like domain-containing protein n=1 Tax=Macrostomum lignano TaxID=282301 RepID=A0A1I8J9V1_9PLAT
MSPPATALRVSNLVGGVDLRLDGGRGAQLPLRELALSMAHVIYRPVWPRVLIKRMRSPRVTLLLYPTGQLSICGAKTHADAKRAARRFVAMLHRRVPAQLLPPQAICVRIKTITAHGRIEGKLTVQPSVQRLGLLLIVEPPVGSMSDWNSPVRWLLLDRGFFVRLLRLQLVLLKESRVQFWRSNKISGSSIIVMAIYRCLKTESTSRWNVNAGSLMVDASRSRSSSWIVDAGRSRKAGNISWMLICSSKLISHTLNRLAQGADRGSMTLDHVELLLAVGGLQYSKAGSFDAIRRAPINDVSQVDPALCFFSLSLSKPSDAISTGELLAICSPDRGLFLVSLAQPSQWRTSLKKENHNLSRPVRLAWSGSRQLLIVLDEVFIDRFCVSTFEIVTMQSGAFLFRQATLGDPVRSLAVPSVLSSSGGFLLSALTEEGPRLLSVADDCSAVSTVADCQLPADGGAVTDMSWAGRQLWLCCVSQVDPALCFFSLSLSKPSDAISTGELLAICSPDRGLFLVSLAQPSQWRTSLKKENHNLSRPAVRLAWSGSRQLLIVLDEVFIDRFCVSTFEIVTMQSGAFLFRQATLGDPVRSLAVPSVLSSSGGFLLSALTEEGPRLLSVADDCSAVSTVADCQLPADGGAVTDMSWAGRQLWLCCVGQILDWVHGPGTKLLDSQRELPRDFEEAERIRKNHEQFEFKCMQALANYASLRDVRTNDNELAERLEKLEITIQDFLRRLQSRRQAVVSLYTFFRLRRDLDSYFKEIADMLVWTDNQQQHQQQRIEETEHYLRQVEKLLRFGESLYQQFCSEAERIRIVITFKEILDIVAAQLAEAKPLLAKQLEMLKIRLLETRRRLQLLVYERDASQTVAWLEDIINAVLDTYLGYCIGKTPVETQQILQQHRTLQAKSQETYDCGLEIIAALTKIYRAQGADTEGCVAMRSNLESNWRRLNEILIEMSDRYATADAFYENVDLNLERIERLILLICRDLDNGMSLEDVRETYANERDEIVKAYENTKRIGVGLMERIQFPVASLPQTVDQTMIDQVQDVIKVKLFTLWLKIRELYYYLGQMIEITEVTERWQIIRVTIDKAESLIEEHRLANDEIGGLWSQLLKDLAELSRDPQVGSLAEQAQADAQRRMEEWQRRWERRMAELDLRLRLLLRLRDLGNEVDDKRTRLAELKTERTVTRAGPVADTVRDVAGLQRGVSDMHSKMESLFAETREKVHRDFERHIEPIEERWREYVKELELLQMFLELILRILQYLEKLDAFIEELTVELPSCRFRDEAEPWLQKIREFNRITDSFDCDWLSNAAIRLYGSSEKPRPLFETSILDMDIVQRVTVTQSAPRRLLRELQDLSLPVGARCHLAVEYSSPSKSADVEWQRNGRPLHTDRLGGKWRLDEGPGYSRVTCDRVTVDDAGDIACLIRDGGSGVAMETSCRLQVLSPPSFVRELQSIRVLEGEPILLQCQVRGSPTPEVVWLKDNWPLRAGVDCDIVVDNLDGICAVKVPTADRSHAGVYKCRATSDAGEAVSVAMVEVQEFIKSRFTRPLADQSVQEGGRLQLHVDFEGEPAPEVTWFRDSQRLFESPPRLLLSTGRGNSTCTIDPLRLEDAGLYSVQLRNPGGVQKTVCNIDVRPKGEAPRCWSQLMDANVLEGSSTRLSCRISGSPPPRIVWRFNGRQLTPRPGLRINSDTYSGVHTLEIDEATKEDDGEYSLLAENPEGRVETRCRLFVESE